MDVVKIKINYKKSSSILEITKKWGYLVKILTFISSYLSYYFNNNYYERKIMLFKVGTLW